jgi:thioesterase domain-containing protein
MLSGDWIPVSLPDGLRRLFPRAQVQSLGGATEAAIWSNGFPIEVVDPRWTSIPYGKPIQNARYHVLAGANLDHAAVKTALARKLPDFMVPSQLAFLDALPLSANGKVDRKALPSPTARLTDAAYLEPRTEAERTMAEIWRDLLKMERVGVRDNFFALGGHSMLAVMMLPRVRQALKLEFPLSLLLQHPTIESLLAVLEMPASAPAPHPHVVTLTRGPRPPLVLFSGIGGFGFVFEGLSRSLGGDQPTHVVHAIGAQDEYGFDHSIEEMATIYLPQVLAVCPESQPIFLGGYSFGALVAFEIAHRLRQAGRQVPLIVSFDGYAPGFPERMPLWGQLMDHVRTFATADGDGRRKYLKKRLQRLAARLRGESLYEIVDDLLPAHFDADQEMRHRLIQVTAGLWRARDVYRPAHRARGDLLLLRSAIPEKWIGSRMDDPTYGWSSWMDGAIDQLTVPATHLTFFSPATNTVMAKAILKAMDARLTPTS